MLRSAVGLFAAFTFSTGAFAQASQDVITQHVEKVATPAAVVQQLSQGFVQLRPYDGTGDLGGIDLSTIINIGKEVWSVIEANKPVVNISYDYATALPKGVSAAGDLAGFSDLQFESYRMYGTNGFGMTVYDVTYTLVHQFGGTYGGKGQYLSTVGVVPSNVDVLWGYDVDLKVTNVATTNVGTVEAPIGSVDLELSFKVHTVIKDHTTTSVFQFRGDTAAVRATDL